MILEEQLDQLRAQHLDRKVDVVESVMARVSTQTPRQRPRTRPLWQPISVVAAAAMVAVLLINSAIIQFHSYDEEGLTNTIVQLNDYSSWHSVEEVASSPYDYLYDE